MSLFPTSVFSIATMFTFLATVPYYLSEFTSVLCFSLYIFTLACQFPPKEILLGTFLKLEISLKLQLYLGRTDIFKI